MGKHYWCTHGQYDDENDENDETSPATPTNVLLLGVFVELVELPRDTAEQRFLFQHKARSPVSLFPLSPLSPVFSVLSVMPTDYVRVPGTKQPRAALFHGAETQQVQQHVGTPRHLAHTEREQQQTNGRSVHDVVRVQVQVWVRVLVP